MDKGILMKNIQIDPNEFLQFNFAPNTPITSSINLRNISSQSLAFKIKTTTPGSYYVRPSQGILTPSESKTIQVILHPIPEYPTNNKDKFLVNIIPTTLDASSSPAVLTTFWDSIQKNRTRVESTKLFVKFVKSKNGLSTEYYKNESVGDGNEIKQKKEKERHEDVELEDKVRMFLWILSFVLVLGIVLVIIF